MTEPKDPFLLLLPSQPEIFFFSIIVISLVIRVFLCALRAFEEKLKSTLHSHSFCRAFVSIFLGRHDQWHPFVLGTLELTAYPVLIVSNYPTYIGAWIAFKTIAQLDWWKREDGRNAFQRFLIGNALVLFAAYALARGTTCFFQS